MNKKERTELANILERSLGSFTKAFDEIDGKKWMMSVDDPEIEVLKNEMRDHVKECIYMCKRSLLLLYKDVKAATTFKAFIFATFGILILIGTVCLVVAAHQTMKNNPFVEMVTLYTSCAGIFLFIGWITAFLINRTSMERKCRRQMEDLLIRKEYNLEYEVKKIIQRTVGDNKGDKHTKEEPTIPDYIKGVND